ncbi:MAG: 30S ribosomal protein S19e [Candidatus Thermoplasmatota archaeon]|nr:30S ribosomal protein S19e [Candidatus Thermoplasmatota archaeon]
MTTAYDVPTDLLIKRTAEKLKALEACKPPEWAPFVKTAVFKDKAPLDSDWWHIREAAILRKVYIKGPIGTIQLRGLFCGPKNRGVKPTRVAYGSGSIIRNALQQLEKAELVTTIKGKGRKLSPKGESLLDNVAREVLQEIIKDNPELGKY